MIGLFWWTMATPFRIIRKVARAIRMAIRGGRAIVRTARRAAPHVAAAGRRMWTMSKNPKALIGLGVGLITGLLLLVALIMMMSGGKAGKAQEQLAEAKSKAGEARELFQKACRKDPNLPECKNARVGTTPAAPARSVKWRTQYTVTAPKENWSDEYQLPSGPFRMAPEEGRRAEVRFGDGKWFELDPDSYVDFGVLDSARFRVRGVGTPTKVYILTPQ